MKIYIAGKITGMEAEAYNLFREKEIDLIAHGFDVVNPMRLPHNHDKTWKSYMKECIAALIKCDGIYLLDNSRESKGARLELIIAKSLGLKILLKLPKVEKKHTVAWINLDSNKMELP